MGKLLFTKKKLPSTNEYNETCEKCMTSNEILLTLNISILPGKKSKIGQIKYNKMFHGMFAANQINEQTIEENYVQKFTLLT